MKKQLLLLSFLICAVVGFSQQRPAGLPSPNSTGYGKIGYQQADSGLIQQPRDTFPAKYPTLIRWSGDNTFWQTLGNGARWFPLASGSLRSIYAGYGLTKVNDSTLGVDTALIATRLRVQKVVDSLGVVKQPYNANTTILGNTTTGSGGTIVLSGSPTLTLPSIAAINVSGGIAALPTGSGTLAYTSALSPYKLISDTLFNGGYTTRNTTKKIADSLAALISGGGFGTVQSVSTTDGVGIVSSVASPTANPNITIRVDTGRATAQIVSGGTLKKVTDSLGVVVSTADALKLNISDTAAMLTPNYRRTITKITNSDLVNSTISGTALGSNLPALSFGTYLQNSATSYNGTTAVTIATNATSSNTGSTLVARDINGDFAARNITASLSGNASSASTVTVTNDNTTNATMYPLWSSASSGNNSAKTSSSKITFNPSTGVLSSSFSGALSGNATTASTLQTARTINGVPFDGSANISISASVDSSLSAGYGITGSPFNGSLGRTWVVDTTKIIPYTDTLASWGIASKAFVRSHVSSGFVPYTGAMGNVDLGIYDISADAAKIKGYLGSELITNGTFASSLTGWSGDNWVWSANGALHNSGKDTTLVQSTTVSTLGKTYKISYDIIGRTNGYITIQFGGVWGADRNSNNSFIDYLTPTTVDSFFVKPSIDFDGSIDNISVKEIISSDSSYFETPTFFRKYITINDRINFSEGVPISIGHNAMPFSSRGQFNVSSSNIAIGYSAAYNTTTGHATAIGYRAAESNTDGVITAVGKWAGLNNTTGHSTMFGNAAGLNSTTSDGVYIGDEAGSSNRTGQVTVVGYYAGNANVNQEITAVGYLSAKLGVSATAVTAIGQESLFNNNASYSSALGHQSGYSNTSGEITTVGYRSLYSNTTGNATAFGVEALTNNTTGNATAFGYRAGYSNTTGQITAIGDSSLYANQTSNSVAVGFRSGFSNTTGRLTALGYNSSLRNTTGNIISIGYSSGEGDNSENEPVTDTAAILIGDFSGRSVSSATKFINYIGIGNRVLIDKSNQVKLGNSSITETNLYGETIINNAGSFLNTFKVKTDTISSKTNSFVLFYNESNFNDKVNLLNISNGSSSDSVLVKVSSGEIKKVSQSSVGSGGTVTSVATNNGSGITGGTITSTGTIAADTVILATRLRVQKGIDSVLALIPSMSGYKLISDSSYNTGYTTRVQTKRMIDSLASVSTGTGTVTSVATNTGSGITGGTITSSGTISADTSVLSTKANITALLLGKLGLTGGSTITTVGTLSSGSIPYSLITGTPSIPTVSGTVDYIPKFTGASTIGNSGITDDGTTVTLNSRALSGTTASFSSTGTFGVQTVINGAGSGYYQAANILKSSTSSNPELRALGTFMFNEGTDKTWFSGNPYGGADNYIISRISGTSFNDQASDPSAASVFFKINSSGVISASSRINLNGASDNSLFSLNNGGGTTYTNGFSPNASNYTGAITLGGGTTYVYTGTGAVTWTLPNPSGNNQIYIIKNNGTGVITLNAYSAGQLIPISSTTGVSSITISVGGTVTIQQDGSSKSYVMNVGSESGTYTPTSSGEVGCNTVTFETFKYSRVGNECHVSGQVTLTRTSASTYFQISLPIPTTISSVSDATGVITSSSYQASGYVKGTSGGAVGINTNSASSSGSQSFIMEFTYIIK